MSSLEGVDGWFHAGEAWQLHEYVRCQTPADRKLRVVEIGSWMGRSTIAIAMGLKARGHGVVHAIDPHVGGMEHLEFGVSVDTFQGFLSNIEKAGVGNYVEPWRARSHDARSRIVDGDVDALFVDGSHLYEDVVRDIRDWTTSLRDGAIIGFNDPLHPEVYRALSGHVLRQRTPFRILGHVDNTLFTRYSLRPQRASDLVAAVWFRGLLRLRHLGGPIENRLPRGLSVIAARLYRRLVSPSFSGNIMTDVGS
jgi:predicted O-methyltransferase YrrM